MSQDEREACCPEAGNTIGKREDGRQVVIKALGKAKLEGQSG